MKLISITGGVGSGKSEVLRILKEKYDAEVIIADEVSHQLTEPGEEGFYKVVGLLGPSVLSEDGKIDRKKMAELLFKERDLVEQINAAVHPLVWEKIKKCVDCSHKKLVIVEAALYDEEHNAIFDEIWYVYASLENRLRRLMDNRGYSKEKCLEIMKNQATDEEYRSFADKIIDNNGKPEALYLKLSKLLKEE